MAKRHGSCRWSGHPVRAGFVLSPQEWLYSPTKNYYGLGDILDVECLQRRLIPLDEILYRYGKPQDLKSCGAAIGANAPTSGKFSIGFYLNNRL